MTIVEALETIEKYILMNTLPRDLVQALQVADKVLDDILHCDLDKYK